jgi:hypothetical protein
MCFRVTLVWPSNFSQEGGLTLCIPWLQSTQELKASYGRGYLDKVYTLYMSSLKIQLDPYVQLSRLSVIRILAKWPRHLVVPTILLFPKQQSHCQGNSSYKTRSWWFNYERRTLFWINYSDFIEFLQKLFVDYIEATTPIITNSFTWRFPL